MKSLLRGFQTYSLTLYFPSSCGITMQQRQFKLLRHRSGTVQLVLVIEKIEKSNICMGGFRYHNSVRNLKALCLFCVAIHHMPSELFSLPTNRRFRKNPLIQSTKVVLATVNRGALLEAILVKILWGEGCFTGRTWRALYMFTFGFSHSYVHDTFHSRHGSGV